MQLLAVCYRRGKSQSLKGLNESQIKKKKMINHLENLLPFPRETHSKKKLLQTIGWYTLMPLGMHAEVKIMLNWLEKVQDTALLEIPSILDGSVHFIP